jgi:SNF2 family DNA or RNA helicase
MKYKFRTKPYPHQVEALKRFWGKWFLALFWEPGTGKTKATIDIACALFQAGKARRFMIVAPLSVLGVWKEEFELHATSPYTLFIMDKTWYKRLPMAVRWSMMQEDHMTVIVVNYDIIWRRKEIAKLYSPGFIVADESHRLKKPSARRSKFMRTMNVAPYRMILTGTPTPKGLVDIYSQWLFLNIKRFGGRIDDFKAEYAVTGGFKGFTIKGYRNVKKLRRLIRMDASIVRKDTALDLPPRTYQRVPVYLEPAAQEYYDKMALEMYLELERGEISDAKNAAVRLLRLQQITGGFIKSDEKNIHQLSTAKLKVAADLLEDLTDDGQRVVVFARFIPEVLALADIGKRLKVRTYTLYGATRREDRDHIRRQFQTKKAPAIFVAQISTGGLGITLHAAHEVLYYSTTYSLEDWVQSADRVHRIGQTEKVTYRTLIAEGTVEEDIYAALRAKKKILRMIMKDPKILKRRLSRDV